MPVPRDCRDFVFVGGSLRCSAYDSEIVSAKAELLAAFEKRGEAPFVSEIARSKVAEE